jgi:hypothetical protein
MEQNMLRDFIDADLVILLMPRGTDYKYVYQTKLPNGSNFVWSQHTVVCEGRLAIARAEKNFTFPTSQVVVDGESFVQIEFPKELITDKIRENKVYWRVLATRNDEGAETVELTRGEIWLK